MVNTGLPQTLNGGLVRGAASVASSTAAEDTRARGAQAGSRHERVGVESLSVNGSNLYGSFCGDFLRFGVARQRLEEAPETSLARVCFSVFGHHDQNLSV